MFSRADGFPLRLYLLVNVDRPLNLDVGLFVRKQGGRGHRGCSARSERTRARLRPGSGPGSQAIREMAEGFSRFKPGCTVQINEGRLSANQS